MGDTFTARAGLLAVEFRVEEIKVFASSEGSDEDAEEEGEPASFCIVTDDTVIDCEGCMRCEAAMRYGIRDAKYAIVVGLSCSLNMKEGVSFSVCSWGQLEVAGGIICAAFHQSLR